MRWVFLLASILPELAAQEPKVMSVNPAVGARDVAVDAGSVLVIFDRPMGSGRDIVPVEGLTMPPLGGDPAFLGAQMLKIPLGPLKGGVDYGFSLNGPRQKGFAASDGTPLAPFTVSFRTAGGPAAPESGPAAGGGALSPVEDEGLAPEDRLLGIWERREGDLTTTCWFRSGGGFTEIVAAGSERKVSDGKWNLADGYLSITTGAFVPKRASFTAPGFPERGAMRWRDADWRRLSGGSVRPVALSVETLAGAWADESEDGSIGYMFTAAGRFQATVAVPGKDAVVRAGTFALDKGRLVLTSRGGAGQLSFEARLQNRDVLDLTDGDGKTHSVQRMGAERDIAEAAPEEPAGPGGAAPAPRPGAGGVVGVWTVRDGTVSAVIEFRADGTYHREWTEDGKRTVSNGKWREDGAVLVAEDEAEGESLRIPFRLITGDVLELTVDGEVLRLARRGASPTLPPELLGTWSASDESGSIRLALAADADFRLEMADRENRYILAGTAVHTAGQLDLTDRETGRRLVVPYELSGGCLVVTLQDSKIPLRREGAR